MESQNCFGISKNASGSQNVLDKVVDIVDTVDIIESVHAIVMVDIVDIVDMIYIVDMSNCQSIVIKLMNFPTLLITTQNSNSLNQMS